MRKWLALEHRWRRNGSNSHADFTHRLLLPVKVRHVSNISFGHCKTNRYPKRRFAKTNSRSHRQAGDGEPKRRGAVDFTYVCTFVCTYVCCSYACTFVRMYVFWWSASARIWTTYVRRCVSTCVSTYVRRYVLTYVRACIHRGCCFPLLSLPSGRPGRHLQATYIHRLSLFPPQRTYVRKLLGSFCAFLNETVPKHPSGERTPSPYNHPRLLPTPSARCRTP